MGGRVGVCALVDSVTPMSTTDPREFPSPPLPASGPASWPASGPASGARTDQGVGPDASAAEPSPPAPIGQLAGGLAHGFNNLLTVIRGNAEVLRDLLTDPRQRVMVDAMLVACGRAHSLAQQLRTFSGKQVIRPQPIDLNVQVADWLQRHRLHFPVDVVVRFTTAAAAAPVLVDPNQLAEVLSRLTVAACDAILATGDDGGRIDVRTERVRNPVGLPAGEYVRLVIAHDGRGLDAAALAKVFEPYGSVADLGDGTDLGLATVTGILRQNRGGIACASAPEVGTTFTLDWPLRTADSVLVPRSPLAGRGELVVLVDDDDGVRQFAAAALRERGYEVLAFADGEAALRLLTEPPTAGDPVAAREPTPAILITDVVMPGIDGKELAARVRQLRPALRVLYISGYSDDILTRDGQFDDDIALLEKPFSGDDLALAVRAVLDTASSR